MTTPQLKKVVSAGMFVALGAGLLTASAWSATDDYFLFRIAPLPPTVRVTIEAGMVGPDASLARHFSLAPSPILDHAQFALDRMLRQGPAVALRKGSALAVFPQSPEEGSSAVLATFKNRGKLGVLTLTEDLSNHLSRQLASGNFSLIHQTLNAQFDNQFDGFLSFEEAVPSEIPAEPRTLNTAEDALATQAIAVLQGIGNLGTIDGVYSQRDDVVYERRFLGRKVPIPVKIPVRHLKQNAFDKKILGRSIAVISNTLVELIRDRKFDAAIVLIRQIATKGFHESRNPADLERHYYSYNAVWERLNAAISLLRREITAPH